MESTDTIGWSYKALAKPVAPGSCSSSRMPCSRCVARDRIHASIPSRIALQIKLVNRKTKMTPMATSRTSEPNIAANASTHHVRLRPQHLRRIRTVAMPHSLQQAGEHRPAVWHRVGESDAAKCAFTPEPGDGEQQIQIRPDRRQR